MRRIFAILLAAGVLITYDSWVLLFLSPHPQPLSGYLSELAAMDQPASWVFRSGDAIAGTHHGPPRRPRCARVALPLRSGDGAARHR
ncbi:hypothetical protein DN536_38190, partial [Burkholderia multivorans]